MVDSRVERVPDDLQIFGVQPIQVGDNCIQLGDQVQVPAAEGAFYLLVRLQTDLDAMHIVTRLVREHKVAVIPGDAFGLNDPCYLRIAYGALRQEDVVMGMDRLVGGLAQILAA